MFLHKFPLLTWARGQLHGSPKACGILSKHFTKPLKQAAASNYDIVTLMNKSANLPLKSLPFSHLSVLPDDIRRLRCFLEMDLMLANPFIQMSEAWIKLDSFLKGLCSFLTFLRLKSHKNRARFDKLFEVFFFDRI